MQGYWQRPEAAAAAFAERADGRWFAVCLAGELLAYAGYIAAYRDFARADGGPKLPLWTVTRVVVVGFGAQAEHVPPRHAERARLLRGGQVVFGDSV